MRERESCELGIKKVLGLFWIDFWKPILEAKKDLNIKVNERF